MPFRVKRQTPLPFPMAKSPGFLVARNRSLEAYIRSLGPAVYLPLTDILTDEWGAASLARNVMYGGGVGAELLTNGDFSAWTGDDPDDWAVTETLNGEVTERDSGDLNADPAGTGAANLYRPGAGDVSRIQQTKATVGDTYRMIAIISAITGQVDMHEAGGVLNQITTVDTHIHDFIAAFTGGHGLQQAGITGDATLDSVSLKKIGELDGLYVGPTLGNDTFAGRPCPTSDGVNDYAQLEYNRLESVFNPDIGSMAIALKLTSAQWQDANLYWAMVIGEGSDDRFMIYKVAANTLRFQVHVGAAALSTAYAVQAEDYDKWLFPICTWNSAQNRFNLHVKASSAAQTYPVGTWTTNDLTSAFCQIGANNTSNFWPGSLASAFLTNNELTAADAPSLYSTAKSQEPLMA